MYLWLRFVFFWRQEIGAKASHKMLVKLTACCQVTLKYRWPSLYGMVMERSGRIEFTFIILGHSSKCPGDNLEHDILSYKTKFMTNF